MERSTSLQAVTVIYKDSVARPEGRVRNDGRKAGRRWKFQPSSIPLSLLRSRLNLTPKAEPDRTVDTGEEEATPGGSWTDSRAYDRVDPFGFQDFSSGEVDFITSLWRMIDQYIEENPFLSEYNHSGKVFLSFTIDENGRLSRGSLKASAADRVLKVIAARAVRKAIRNETGDIHFPRKRILVHARFSWADYRDCNGLRGYRGNFLSFCHYGENKRKTFSTGERVATWAGSIYNYGPWAYEEIKKYNREESRRKSEFNPFAEYERDPDWNL